VIMCSQADGPSDVASGAIAWERQPLATAGPTFVDLFSGCGGLSLGFHQAGYSCQLAVDNDPQAVQAYNLNLSNGSPGTAVLQDACHFKSRGDVSSFLAHHGIGGEACDVVVGGPPCQSFSVVGRLKTRALMATDEARKHWTERHKKRVALFEAFALFVEVLKPRWFLFENVPTIVSHATFPEILARFGGLSDGKTPLRYRLFHKNYVASRYGVPQDRRRFILVGYRDDLGIEDWPGPAEKPVVPVSAALDDLPVVSHGHKKRRIRYSGHNPTSYQRLMRSGIPKELREEVCDHICRWHNDDDVALFARMKPGARFADVEVQKAIREINPEHKLIKYSTDKFKDKLHKLDPQRPAWTVTAHLQKDCYKFIHHQQPRTITVREAARLQSFPDWFRLDGLPMVSCFRLIGNAVPPLLATAFADSFTRADPAVSARV